MITTLRQALTPASLRSRPRTEQAAPQSAPTLGADTRVSAAARPARASSAEATRQAEALLASSYHPDPATFARNLAALQLAAIAA